MFVFANLCVCVCDVCVVFVFVLVLVFVCACYTAFLSKLIRAIVVYERGGGAGVAGGESPGIGKLMLVTGAWLSSSLAPKP